MPCSYTIHAEARLVTICGWGVITTPEVVAMRKMLGADPRFRPDFAELDDYSRLTRVALDFAGVREAAAVNPYGPGARRAVVVGSDEAYGVARQYQQVRGEAPPDELQIFRSLAPALSWLGLSAATLPTGPGPDRVFGSDSRAPC